MVIRLFDKDLASKGNAMKPFSHRGALGSWLSSTLVIGILAGCSGSTVRPVQSAQAGGTTLTLSAPGGHLVNGTNTVTVDFSDALGTPRSVQSSRIRFFMPAMGGMSTMDERASLAPTGHPGAYRATVDLPSTGTWQTTVTFTAPSGPAVATFNVQVS